MSLRQIFYFNYPRKTFPYLFFFRYRSAHMDWGKFRDALDYGHHQLGISEELDNPQMRSEAYLNLARAHEKLGEKRQF
jgi:Rapsyn N-terminal myristoylation and linker region